jgi:tetratricopeptide (TPR) repeat protein
LLQRSRKEEEAGRKDAALEAVQVLLNLAPDSVAGFDRLACLHFREGDLDRAVAMLEGWRRLAPQDHWPLVRQAIIEQQRGNMERRRDAIDQALGLTAGPLQASIAFLGARLALHDCVMDWQKAPPTSGIVSLTESLGQTLTLLQQCLQADPGHVEGLWSLAAVHSVLGNQNQLQKLAPRLDRPEVTDARFHYLGAVCQLARQDYGRVIELSQRAAVDETLAVESHYLAASAYLHLNDPKAAAQSLHQVAVKNNSPSVEYARGLLGRLSYDRQAYDEAIKWWTQLDTRRRTDWNLEEPLRQTVLLAGLLAFGQGRYEAAGDRFREAAKLGLRDRRLGPLLILALVKAGQRLLFEQAAK